MIRRGAPFDLNNFFNIPVIDAGEFDPGNVLKLSKLDGQAFSDEPANYFDGGTIPLQGTASYDPSITYGPDSPLIED